MKKYGSHNSWTFLSPYKWYMKPFHFLSKCQEVNIKELYNKGIRLFDLRVKFINNIPYVYHGLFNFGVVPYMDLLFLNDNKCYIRVILESNSEMKDQENQELLFRTFCEKIQKEFPDIIFIGGTRKYDGLLIYNFNTNPEILLGKYSSVTSLFNINSKLLSLIDDLFPKIYAWFMNKKNIKEYNESDSEYWFFYDFVNIC